jgi:hypothetical protein
LKFISPSPARHISFMHRLAYRSARYGDVTPVHSHATLYWSHYPLEIDNLPTRSRGALMSVCSDDDTLNGLVTFPSEAQTGSHPVQA